MDPVSLLLDAPRSRRTSALRVLMSGEWSISVEDDAPLTVCSVLRGTCALSRHERRRTLTEGDVLVVTGSDPYVLSSSAGIAPSITIGLDGGCRGGDGRDLTVPMRFGVRTWGNDADGECDLLIATYASESEVGRQLLHSLPPEIIERTEVGDLRAIITDQLTSADPGQATVVNRLLDVLLIATVRQWASRDSGPSWWSVGRDRQIAASIRRIDADDRGELSPDDLATEAGLSRSAYNKRFRDVVGMSPGEYARRSRLAKAADALRDPSVTLAAVAHRLGYSSPFSLSNAFKTQYGVSPKDYRSTMRKAD